MTTELFITFIWWTIWKERNSRCFEGRGSSIQKIKSSCISLLHFWCKEKLFDDIESLLDLMASLQVLFEVGVCIYDIIKPF